MVGGFVEADDPLLSQEKPQDLTSARQRSSLPFTVGHDVGRLPADRVDKAK